MILRKLLLAVSLLVLSWAGGALAVWDRLTEKYDGVEESGHDGKTDFAKSPTAIDMLKHLIKIGPG